MTSPNTPPTTDERTIGALVADASRDLSSLVQSEIALAKSELRVSVKNLGLGGGLLAAAGFLAVLMVILGSFAIAYFIAWALPVAYAFLIVAGFYFLLTVILVLIGISRLKKIRPPEQTIATSKQLPEAFKPGSGNSNALPR